MSPLPYPVLWCDVETAERLFCIAPSTFREHVAEGRLPQGVKIGKKRLWRVADVDEALAKLLPQSNDEDEIMRLIRGMGNGPKAKARINAA
jgi:predicted DNA-binding transcriptional regulator AlpA